MDFTSLWAFLQQHKSRLTLIPLGIILFAAGWQTGRVTSPYYAAHPIVFEDRQCPESCGTSGGSATELQTLQEEGRVAGAGGTAASSTPSVVPAAVKEATAGEVAGTSAGKFVGSVNSDLYHDPSCPAADRIKKANQIWFASQAEAEAAGYAPSKCTQEKLAIE